MGQVLKPGQNANGYALADADVPAKFFNGNAKSPEALQAFQQAGGNVGKLSDYATYSLRDAAVNEDGTINPAKFDRWTQKHSEALKAFPELQARFADARTAQDTLDQTVAAHKAAIQTYENSAAKQFLKNDPAAAVKNSFGPNSQQTFRHLVQLASADTTGAAQAGLRRAVVEHIQTTLKGTQEAGNTGTDYYKADQFQKFVRQNRGALNALFGKDGVSNIEAVATDIKRSGRSVNTKLPGQSNTMQDANLSAKHGSILGKMVSKVPDLIGGAIGYHLGGEVGAGVGLMVPEMAHGLRQAGISKVNQLVDQAMLNPNLARELLAKIPNDPSPMLQRRLASRLRATIPAVSINSASQIQSAQ